MKASRGDPAQDAGITLGSFLRGLSLGALVGAAIAGSALLRRRATERPRTGTDDERKLPAPPL